MDILFFQQFEQALQMDIEDAGHGLFGNRREGHDFGQTAQKFGAEIVLHDIHQVVVPRDHPLVERIDDELAADVGGKQNQGVREIAHPTQSVVQFSFVQNLQEEVEDRLMGLSISSNSTTE